MSQVFCQDWWQLILVTYVAKGGREAVRERRKKKVLLEK